MGRNLSLKNKKILEKLYFNLKSSCSFSSPNLLYKKCKNQIKNITLSDIKLWLEKQDSYSLHKAVKYKFQRRSILVSHIDDTWQIDLVDMIKLKRQNKGHCYLLTCIDVFSKFAWVIAIKNKQAKTVTDAFKSILLNSKRKPNKIHSDKGSEFKSNLFQELLKNKNIKFYTTENETKACVVERFHRTLKMRMWKYFTHKNTKQYINILSDLVSAYNNSFHRSIQMAPIEVTKNNSKIVFLNLYKNKIEKKKPSSKFKVNDKVRISKAKKLFAKGYEHNWSDELYVITKIDTNQDPFLYFLCDFKKEPVIGTFYEQELQKITQKKYWAIEKILKKRLKNNQRELFIKWTGHSSKFNSWIKEADLQS